MSLRMRITAFRMGTKYEHLKEILDPVRPISEAEHIQRFESASWALYWQAERARILGISWRNFCVGCAVWAFRKDASTIEDRFRVFYGMNTKVAENSRNICAEPVPMGAALASAYTKIIGLVVVGNPQADERGETPLTLRPCAHCRELMRHHPLIKPDTYIVCAHPPSGGKPEPESWDQVPHEVFTFEELLAQYGEKLLQSQESAQTP